jgi:hypothetical protein
MPARHIENGDRRKRGEVGGGERLYRKKVISQFRVTYKSHPRPVAVETVGALYGTYITPVER